VSRRWNRKAPHLALICGVFFARGGVFDRVLTLRTARLLVLVDTQTFLIVCRVSLLRQLRHLGR
jgi:hypothetical protein